MPVGKPTVLIVVVFLDLRGFTTFTERPTRRR